MLSVNATIKDLDYDSVIEFALPMLKANPPEVNGNFIVKAAFNKLLNSDSSKVKSLLAPIPDSWKSGLVESQVNKNRAKIQDAIMNMASAQNISFSVDDFTVSRIEGENSFSVSCNVINIDYKRLARKFLPIVHLDDSDKGMGFYLNTILSVLNKKIQSVEKIIGAIDNKAVEKFIVFLVDDNYEKIQEALLNLIESKGISLTLYSIGVEVI